MVIKMSIILAVIIIIQAILLIKEIHNRKKDKVKYEEQDSLLARYVADNLDMKKRLSDI